MEENWLNSLDQHSAVLVPTRSLANTLTEQIVSHNISLGNTVWENPNILLWSDYLQLWWQQSKSTDLITHGARTLISARQSSLLWTQIVEASRREERNLTLLDVNQTVKAVQRSWRLINDWGVELDSLRQDHVADTEQFIAWIDAYTDLLTKRRLIDASQLQHQLLNSGSKPPFRQLIWYCYDLVTATQSRFNQRAESLGKEIVFRSAETEAPTEQQPEPETLYTAYADSNDELIDVLEQSRSLIELNPAHTVNIVIPDLQSRRAVVSELARSVFYPGIPPLEVLQSPSVYRFSLGQPLNEWPAIDTALKLLKLLNNRTTVTEFSAILRNQFLTVTRGMDHECRLFERWLTRQRLRQFSVDRLPELYQQCLEYLDQRNQQPEQPRLPAVLEQITSQLQALQQKLEQEKLQNGFAALSFAEWIAVYQEWLTTWGWNTEVAKQTLSSVQYQLHQRWLNLIEELAGLALVQKRVGLNRAAEILRQMCRDAIFQPQAVASPILISGVFEAIGRPTDSCFLLAMDQGYPAPSQNDVFIPNRILRELGYPDASAEKSFLLAKQVTNNLLSASKQKRISYSERQELESGLRNQISPLFRNQIFNPPTSLAQAHKTDKEFAPPVNAVEVMDQYEDLQGPALAANAHARGGSKIFEHQSICAFRAFVNHRLGFLRSDEAEFGLDGMDRGQLVHELLDQVWQKLQNQAQLLELTAEQLDGLISAVVDEVCQQPGFDLSEDKTQLLQYEKPRLRRLLNLWLQYEKRRPTGFSVIEREEQRTESIGGINFDYVIDRLDLTDDGRSLIIDYKTGQIDRNDWLGERLSGPQLPLYALALDKIKRTPVAGIAFAKIDPLKPEFVELCEANILRSDKSKLVVDREQLWQDQRASWPQLFENLANDFIQGQAEVNPIDEATCQYCELKAVCRVSQLREQTNTEARPEAAQ